jgi:hypothetical protein
LMRGKLELRADSQRAPCKNLRTKPHN